MSDLEMSDPVPPSIRSGVREWNLCLDHPLVYVGVTGPHWFRHHLWVCVDESHEPKRPDTQYRPPAFETADGSGYIDCAPVNEAREALGFWVRHWRECTELQARCADGVD